MLQICFSPLPVPGRLEPGLARSLLLTELRQPWPSWLLTCFCFVRIWTSLQLEQGRHEPGLLDFLCCELQKPLPLMQPTALQVDQGACAAVGGGLARDLAHSGEELSKLRIWISLQLEQGLPVEDLVRSPL
jgi:hypothetical protein